MSRQINEMLLDNGPVFQMLLSLKGNNAYPEKPGSYLNNQRMTFSEADFLTKMLGDRIYGI